MTAPAFDDVDAFGHAEEPAGGEGTVDPRRAADGGVEAYQLEGYQLEGYRLEAPGPDRVAPAAAPPLRARRAPRRIERQRTRRPASTPTEANPEPGFEATAGPRPSRRARPHPPLRLRRKANPANRLRAEDRPYARLGLLWALCLVVGLIVGSAALAVLLAPVGLVAAASALRAARRDSAPEAGEDGIAEPAGESKPELVLFGRSIGASDARTAVLAGVVVTPLVALGGPLPAVAAALLVIVGAALSSKSLGCSPVGAALAVAAPVSAMCALVVARDQGFAVAMVFVAAVCTYDAAACLMGNRATGGFVGVVSGLLTLAALGFLVTALANPPFGGDRAWVFCLMVGVLAWLGVKLCRVLMRGGPTLPALARLDSLVVAGPAWVIAVAFVLNR